MFRSEKATAERPLVLHMVTWYPGHDTDIDGIFTRRHIELLAADKRYRHIVVQQSKTAFSVVQQVKSLAGSFVTRKIGGLNIIQLPDDGALNRRFLWRYKQQLWQWQLAVLIKLLKPSLLHLHVTYGFAREALYMKKKWGIPFIISEHMAPFPFEWLHNKEACITEPVKQASQVVAVGQAQAQQIKNFTGIEPVIIPNVVNPGEFYYATKKETSGLHIVLVGIYDSRKGADYLLETLPAFLQKHPGTIVHLVGDVTAERKQLLCEIINSRGIDKAILFHGRMSATELCALYHTCDFYVCSSEWESFGVSVLEALFAGVPVLATDCGGVLEFMNTGNGMVIANDRKRETLLGGMLKLTDTLHLYNRRQISSKAIDRFSGERIKEQYFSIYQKILGS